MAETTGTREPFTVTPSKVVYAPDTLRGKIDQVVEKVRRGYGRYFKGENPVVKTKQEEGQSKQQLH